MYVATWTGFIDAAFTIDAFARRIVGWRVAGPMHADLVLGAFKQAFWAHQGTKGLSHYCDRGR